VFLIVTSKLQIRSHKFPVAYFNIRFQKDGCRSNDGLKLPAVLALFHELSFSSLSIESDGTCGHNCEECWVFGQLSKHQSDW